MPLSCRLCGTWTQSLLDVNWLRVLLYTQAVQHGMSTQYKHSPCCMFFRVSDRRPRSEAVPRPHGRVSGHRYTRRRGGKAQVRWKKSWFWASKYPVSVTPYDHTVNVSALTLLLCYRMAHYEGGAVCSQARSLWRLEPLRIRWLSTQSIYILCCIMLTFKNTL